MGTNCAPLLANLFCYSQEAEFIIYFSQQEGNSWHLGTISQTGTSMKFCPDTTQSFRITWTRCILLNLRSRTQMREILLVLTLIYSCRFGKDCQLYTSIHYRHDYPISISQTFRFRVAIIYLRPSMAYLSTSYNICLGLFLPKLFYSDGNTTFQ